MNRQYHSRKFVYWTIVIALMLGGCSGKGGMEEQQISFDEINGQERETENARADAQGQSESDLTTEASNIRRSDTSSDIVSESSRQNAVEESELTVPQLIEADWSEVFHGLNGAAVIYNAADSQYTIFNTDLARTRRSPCSTFKIISSLIALENGILVPEDTTRTWSGEVFWNEDWNRDIDFQNAFRTSCVWYFREVIDAVGQEIMQEGLNQLQYGNCDISDWQGHLNTNNNNRALTGFWIESSLLISPQEQTEVMERIFGTDSTYTETTTDALKQVMLVPEQDNPDINIYGKTGMGKAEGITVDAWFTGFAEKPAEEKTIYFCVYLGRTDNQNVTSAAAKEIAVKLVSAYLTDAL